MEQGPTSTAAEPTSEPAASKPEVIQLSTYPTSLRMQFSQALASERTGDIAKKNAILQALSPQDAAGYENYKALVEQLRLDAIKTASHPDQVAPTNPTEKTSSAIVTSYESKRTVTASEKSTNSDATPKVKSTSCCTLS